MIAPVLDSTYDYKVDFEKKTIALNVYTSLSDESIYSLPFTVPGGSGYTCSVTNAGEDSDADADIDIYNNDGEIECTYKLYVYFQAISQIGYTEPIENYSINLDEIELYWEESIVIADLDATTINNSLNISLYKPDLYSYTIERAKEENDDGELIDANYFFIKITEKESGNVVKRYIVYNYTNSDDDYL